MGNNTFGNMCGVLRIVGCLVCLLWLVTGTVWADTQAGINWLSAQQQTDGRYETIEALATPIQATAETLRALVLLGQAPPPLSRDYLAAETFHNTEYLARKIIAVAEAGQSTTALVAELLPHLATVDLPAHGHFRLDVPLQAEPRPGTGPVQILDVSTLQLSISGTETALFHAQVKNLTTDAQEVLLVGKVYDVEGIEIATVAPYLNGTEITDSNRSFLPDETQTLTIPWDTEQFAPGVYRLVLRAVVPGTIWSATPLGEVIDEGSDSVQVTAIQAFAGQFAATPPLLQAGSSVPAQIDALILNNGNTPMAAASFNLLIPDPAGGAPLYSASATVDELAVGNNQILNFGAWVPTEVGELPVTITSPEVPGEIQGTLYVGDKATGSFTIDQDIVPEGSSTIAGSITVNGVDVTQGSSTDPQGWRIHRAQCGQLASD